MGDQGPDESDGAAQPLLAHAQEDQLWDRVEQAPPVEEITVQQLINERPEGVLKFLQSQGVRKLGEFCVQDSTVLGKLGDDSIMTMGAEAASIDYEAAWRRELGPPVKDKAGWSTTIPVIAYVVSIKGAARPDKDGLLQPLLKRWQAGGCSYSVFALPAVQAVIDWKWERFCRRLLLWELACYMLWLVSFSVFTIAFQDEDTTLTLGQLLATPRGRLTVACDILALIGMSPFVLIEFVTIGTYGFWGWLSAWNLLDVTTYTIQIAIVVMHLGRLSISSGWLSIAAAVQCVLLLFRLQYFSRVFRPTRFAFVDSIKEVLHDVKFYLIFLILVIGGFATAFHVLFRLDQDKHEEFSTIGKAFMTMVTWVAGNADLNPMYEHAHNPVAACVLAVAYVFILATILMNLLIGLMTNTLEKVTENEGLRMLLSKAQVIDEIEASIPGWVERRLPHLYPTFVHVLRVDPQKLDTVKLDRLWSKEGDDEEGELLEGAGSEESSPGDKKKSGRGEEGEEAGGEIKAAGARGREQGPRGRDRESVLEQKIDAVWQELQQLKAMMRVANH